MRPDTRANAGRYWPSTPSRAIRTRVSTGRGPRSRAMKRARAAGPACSPEGSHFNDSASARAVRECRPRTCGCPAQAANSASTSRRSPSGQYGAAAAR